MADPPESQLLGPAAARYTVSHSGQTRRLSRRGPTKTAADQRAANTANARLILHRTAVLVDGEDGLDLDDEPVRTWAVRTNLGQGTDAGKPSLPGGGVPAQVSLLQAVAVRRRAAIASLAASMGAASMGLESATVELAPEAALLTGAGTGGIRDVGIELHGTYGWPILPGSTLKGVTREYARDEAAGVSPGTQRALFGEVTADGETIPGRVTFLDALPGPGGVRVAEHVLTPHTRGYRDADPASDDVEVPGEYINPVPIPFLAVEHGCFVVHLLGPPGLLDEAVRLLVDAVADLGVGAKTSSGYGYLAPAPPATATAPPTGQTATTGGKGKK